MSLIDLLCSSENRNRRLEALLGKRANGAPAGPETNFCARRNLKSETALEHPAAWGWAPPSQKPRAQENPQTFTSEQGMRRTVSTCVAPLPGARRHYLRQQRGAPQPLTKSACADGERSEMIDPLPNDIRMVEGFAAARNPVGVVKSHGGLSAEEIPRRGRPASCAFVQPGEADRPQSTAVAASVRCERGSRSRRGVRPRRRSTPHHAEPSRCTEPSSVTTRAAPHAGLDHPDFTLARTDALT